MLRRKFQVPEIVLGILLTVAVFAMGAVFESSRHQPANQASNTKAADVQETNNPDPFTWDWFTHDGTVFFTGVLSLIAGIQAALFLSQLRIMRDGMDDARMVAKATDRNTRAAVALQLPHILIEPSSLGKGDQYSPASGRTESCSVHYVQIANLGKTRAFPKEILYAFVIGETLPEKPPYQFGDKFPMGQFIEPDAPATRHFLTFDAQLKPGEWAKIAGGNFLWFYCDLIYDDFMGETRHWSNCWKWTGVGTGGLGWRPEAAPAYNRKT